MLSKKRKAYIGTMKLAMYVSTGLTSVAVRPVETYIANFIVPI